MSKPTRSPESPSVSELQMSHALEEVGGRITAPNRLDEILKRAAEQREAALQPTGHPNGRLWAAALLFLGLAATITAGILKSRGESDEATVAQGSGDSEHARNGMQIAIQDPKPAPQPTSEPTPKQGPALTRGDDSGKTLPKGTDPADLALLRSAEKMLEAEKNLKEMIENGRIAGVDQVLGFDMLGGWEYSDGLKGIPQKVRDLDGKKVLMLGFMLPIDEVENIKEFLLVESLWSCCYGTPPNIHGIVRCMMPDDKRLDYQFDPLKLVGTIKVEATMMDGYCVDIFQLHVEYVEVLDGVKEDSAKDEPGKKSTAKKVTGKKTTGK